MGILGEKKTKKTCRGEEGIVGIMLGIAWGVLLISVVSRWRRALMAVDFSTALN